MPDKLTRQQIVELKATILARGLSIDSLAERTGLGVDVVRMIMDGRLHPVPEIRKRLGAALGINPDRLQ